MQARYAFQKFEGTERLQNIRYQQICMHDNIDIHLHFQKKYASSSKPPVLANLYTRRCLIPKLCPQSNLRCRQICIQDRSIFPKICVITSLQNLRYRQICMHDNIDIHLHFQKNMRRLQNLRYWQICIQDGV